MRGAALTLVAAYVPSRRTGWTRRGSNSRLRTAARVGNGDLSGMTLTRGGLAERRLARCDRETSGGSRWTSDGWIVLKLRISRSVSWTHLAFQRSPCRRSNHAIAAGQYRIEPSIVARRAGQKPRMRAPLASSALRAMAGQEAYPTKARGPEARASNGTNPFEKVAHRMGSLCHAGA